MSRYRRTPDARADLDDIFSTIAATSPRAALRMNDRFLRRFREIAVAPEPGRVVADLQPGMRRVNEGVYAVFFREADREVQTLRVVHGARNLGSMFS